MRRYTKEQLEDLVVRQLDNLNIQGDHLRLLQEQNDLLTRYNQKLLDEITEARKKMKKYESLNKRGKAKES